ncbi:MAG: hypothetical protein AB8G15_00715 [Saprospiraceae bacterium]
MKTIDRDIENIIKEYQFSFKESNANIITDSSQFSSFDKLFYEAFPNLSFEQKTKVNYISDLLYIAVMTTDRVIDNQEESYWQELVFFSKILWEKAQLKLVQLFPVDHAFWEYYNKYNRQFIQACLLEQKLHFKKIQTYSRESFNTIAAGKATIAKVPIIAMCFLADQSSFIPKLELSIDHYFTGLQLKDDLIDWRIDLKEKRYSYLLTQVIRDKKWEDQLAEIHVDAIGRVIFYADYAVTTIKEALQLYQQAIESLENIDCTDWKKFIANDTKNSKGLQQHIEDTVAQEIEKIEVMS